MGIQDSIGYIKNRAINNIVNIIKSSSNYSWQEEPLSDNKLFNIEVVVEQMQKDIENVKIKYKKRRKE